MAIEYLTDILLPRDPQQPMHAATMQFVETAVAEGGGGGDGVSQQYVDEHRWMFNVGATDATNTDLNTIDATGLYQVNASANAPLAESGFLIVLRAGENETVPGLYMAQVWWSENAPPRQYIRNRAGGAWSAWVAVSGGGGLDQATADARYLRLIGGALSGDLTLNVPAGDHGITVNSPNVGSSPMFMLSKMGLPIWAFTASDVAAADFLFAAFDDSGDYLGEVIGLSRTGTTTTYGTLIMKAGTASSASARIPHGAAPTTPVNGDVWTTTAGLFARINGATVNHWVMWSGTQTAYNAIGTKDPNTLYCITGA